MVGDAMVGPAREVELSDLSDFMNASLQSTVSHSREESKGKDTVSECGQSFPKEGRAANNASPGKKGICSCTTQ